MGIHACAATMHASARRDRGEEVSPSLEVARVWCIVGARMWCIVPLDGLCERYVMSQQTSYELWQKEKESQ